MKDRAGYGWGMRAILGGGKEGMERAPSPGRILTAAAAAAPVICVGGKFPTSPARVELTMYSRNGDANYPAIFHRQKIIPPIFLFKW